MKECTFSPKINVKSKYFKRSLSKKSGSITERKITQNIENREFSPTNLYELGKQYINKKQ